MGSSASSPLAPGYRLDRYELLGPLAEGGMASVWIARQRGKHGFEKLVAIKTILPQFASDDRFRQMFLDEARIASRIEHFNVARILDLGEEHDVLYLVMEYIDGDSLSKLRRECKKAGLLVPPGIALRVLADACSGLHEAHELRGEDGQLLEIVHRDVSPHNVLISTKGVAKLIDFGIAKARDRLAGDTNAGVLKGKIQYMAPEQALGRRIDRRSDVWAIGASLYHMLSGRPAFHAENTLETLHLLTSGKPPDPLPPTIHPAVAAVAHRALSTAPDQRFSTAAELRDAIDAAMVEARIPTTTTDVAAFVLEHLAERTAKRRRVIDIAIAAAAERERIEAVLQPSIDRGTGLTAAGPHDDQRTLADAPDARRLLEPFPLTIPPDAGGSFAQGVASRRQSRGPALVAGGLFIVLAVAAGFAFTAVQARMRSPAVLPDPGPAARSDPTSPPGPAVSAAPSTAASAPQPGDVDAVASAAPSTQPAPSAPARPVAVWRPGPQAAARPVSPALPVASAPEPPPAPPPPQRKKNVDDGF